jgi:hypothetical protein
VRCAWDTRLGAGRPPYRERRRLFCLHFICPLSILLHFPRKRIVNRRPLTKSRHLTCVAGNYLSLGPSGKRRGNYSSELSGQSELPFGRRQTVQRAGGLPRRSSPGPAGPLTCRRQKIPSARQLVRQDGDVTAPCAGRGRPGWPMAAHQLASAYKLLPVLTSQLNCDPCGKRLASLRPRLRRRPISRNGWFGVPIATEQKTTMTRDTARKVAG